MMLRRSALVLMFAPALLLAGCKGGTAPAKEEADLGGSVVTIFVEGMKEKQNIT